MDSGGLDSEPLKMTSSMPRPRRFLALCSPITQRMASTMLDLPQPLGPTMPVTPSSNVKTLPSMNDLKPVMSRRLIRIQRAPERRGADGWKCAPEAGKSASERSAGVPAGFE